MKTCTLALTLDSMELCRLKTIAKSDLRTPEAQARYILRSVLFDLSDTKNNIGVKGSEATHADVVQTTN